MVRGRFAPSPTGDLHLGSAVAALFAFALARRAGGEILLRVEDLDVARTVPGAEARIAADLAWLGLDFDGSPDRKGPLGPFRQSERIDRYRAALDALLGAGRAYACDCSRADVARAASAPHAGDEGPRYAGTCRDAPPDRVFKRPPAIRFRARDASVEYVDTVRGDVTVERVDDFVIRRGDGVFAYQLAVAVDDAAMGITDVVRGADLLGSAPRQVAILQALDAPAPRYTHVPLLVEPDGSRLAKRRSSEALADLRARSVDPDVVIRALAAAYGHPLPDEGRALPLLVEVADPRKLPDESVDLTRVVRRL